MKRFSDGTLNVMSQKFSPRRGYAFTLRGELSAGASHSLLAYAVRAGLGTFGHTRLGRPRQPPPPTPLGNGRQAQLRPGRVKYLPGGGIGMADTLTHGRSWDAWPSTRGGPMQVGSIHARPLERRQQRTTLGVMASLGSDSLQRLAKSPSDTAGSDSEQLGFRDR
uniref:Uncharacterized protein n=1 Tax=Sphaerodactylus townsendi TaxID=933632 RepID=A0ACB8EWB8_9SAUR